MQKNIHFSQLRKKVGMVPQQAVLFKGTIRDNMKWGKEDATEEEIQRALSIAQASDFVNSKPEGLNTMVSQGRRQFIRRPAPASYHCKSTGGRS